jgi:hypothetical protein
MIGRALTWLVLLLPLLGLVGACGRTQSGGDEGSETHWLSECSSNADCELGECLCGVCTMGCTSVRDCPTPLDLCLAQRPSGGECADRICQVPPPGQSAAAAQQGADPTFERLGSCDVGRVMDFVRTDDVRFADTEGTPSHAALDGDGFLVFGPNVPGFLRLSSRGDYVRLLPPPGFEVEAQVDHAAPQVDGSLLLSGIAGEPRLEHGWIGKLDENWNPLWEYRMELESVEHLDLEPLPDGGAVVAGVRWLDRLEGEGPAEDDVLLARFGGAGELLWERRLSFNKTHSFSNQRGFRTLALVGQSIRVVVPSDDGIYVVTSDLDGNVDQASMSRSLPESMRSFTSTGIAESIGIVALPDGGAAVYSIHNLVLLDAAGELRLQHDVAGDEYIGAVRFDAARTELVMAGHYVDTTRYDLPGPWLRALLFDGEIDWEARRPALSFGAEGKLEGAADSGPPLTGAAIDNQGNMLMTGQVGRGLEWVWVGAEACGG